MNMRRLPVLAGSALCLGVMLAGPASAQLTVGDLELQPMPGEFFVANGESKGIAHTKRDETYRICVTRANINVPLKVMHDGQEAMVSPGDCADFEAMNLRVSPGGELPQDFVLAGHFHHLK